jgi:hypothetical protein
MSPRGIRTAGRRLVRVSIWLLSALIVVALLAVIYVRSNPLVFNESLWQHAHCIKIAGLQLHGHAHDHGGKFPFHPKGYGNALLLLDPDTYFALTGPGYDAAPFHAAKLTGKDLSEEDCGRVYVQRLTTKSNSEIALLFDKLPTPGGDHCHFPNRLWARLGREVWFVSGHMEFVAESSWPEFAQKQVKLLVEEGFDREEAEGLFAAKSEQR